MKRGLIGFLVATIVVALEITLGTDLTFGQRIGIVIPLIVLVCLLIPEEWTE